MSKKYKITKKDLVIIQNFIDTIPYEDYIEVSKGSRFEVDIPEEHIFLGSKRFTQLDKYFFEWLAQRQKSTNYNFFVIALLHEVGHIMTQDDDNLEQRDILDKIHSFMFDTDLIDERQYNYNYFGFPAEIEATEWAIEYYDNNRQECDKLAAMLGV